MDEVKKEAALRVLNDGPSRLGSAFVWESTPQGWGFWNEQYGTDELSLEGRAYLEAIAYGEPVAVADSNGNVEHGNRFKVGDRVRVVRRGDDDGGSFHSAKIGDEFTVTKIYDEPETEIHTNVWYFYPHEIEPVDASLTIQAGRFYRTRDGRKVGPMRKWYHKDIDHPWEDGDTGDIYSDNGTSDYNEDIVAEWSDEPAATPTPTTGFTVPLDAPEFGGAESKFKVGDKVEHIDLKETGTGVIEDVFDNGTVGVRWSSWHGYCTDPVDVLRLVAEATTAQEPSALMEFKDGKFYLRADRFEIHSGNDNEPPTSIADIVRRLERLESAMWQRAA